MSETTKSVYLRALELLEERGWCQGDGVDSEGRHCIAGAIHAVYGLNPKTEPCTPECYALGVRLGYGESTRYLGRWNDAPERTFDDVKKLLLEMDSACGLGAAP